ncbi:RibD family protein [Candidatus Uabimicrobium amorphum]|uniref:Riboflavin biosynthesis protein RibD n=1 Tax=Uabimicrobium amorphum TaxID=2596890 RepID=A0A5S9F398_UABAM|nr:RibD family protein [Candidatus Uabimicrobium amorphum]BBM84031.1 riboflavin biosynthesis protein RibD [Candidatus Uabimicrobium amorphum]
MDKDVENSCWRCLYLLRRKVMTTNHEVHCCHLHFGIPGCENVFINEKACGNSPYHVSVKLGKTTTNSSCDVVVDNDLNLSWLNDQLPTSLHNYFELYLPYCFAYMYAKQYRKPYTTSHTAQSLDGCTATKSGHSKWIGNQQNLIHAHRMRALCDAVLIGKNTLINDQPKLNVRHVEGSCPKRVIIGGGEELDFSSLVDADPGIIIHATKSPYPHASLNTIKLDNQENENSLENLLCVLCKKFNIYSVYIEGGAKIISSFLQQKLLNVMQMHISPMLIGDGMRICSLPAIEEIKEAQKFIRGKFFPIDDEIMFVGIPQ